MIIQDAAKILGITGSTTPKQTKAAYRKAAMQYHPDRNPAGAEMMKIVNEAYETLKDFDGEIEQSETTSTEDYPNAVNDALNTIIDLVGIDIEICGAWVWVSGDTFKHKTILKEAGFKYASKKKHWYFRPEDWSSRSRNSLSMDDIRDKYGSAGPRRKTSTRIAQH